MTQHKSLGDFGSHEIYLKATRQYLPSFFEIKADVSSQASVRARRVTDMWLSTAKDLKATFLPELKFEFI